MPRLLLLAVVAFVLVASPAQGSEQLGDLDASFLSLKVNASGEALVSYQNADGVRRDALVWGAVNALPPDSERPQVRFRFDYSGGWRTHGLGYPQAFRDGCRPYDGPALVFLVAACTAPDGSYWALQRWQRRLPLLGFDAWLPHHAAWELHVSHWSGPVAELQVSPNWNRHGFQSIFGRLTYRGAAVYGLASTPRGNPRDRFGRNVYIDTFNSTYGPGWKREQGILTHTRTGTFCHSFAPHKPYPGYPSLTFRPAAPGERYRVTVMGPGVTPVVQWEGRGLVAADRELDEQFNRSFDRVMAGDRLCARQR